MTYGNTIEEQLREEVIKGLAEMKIQNSKKKEVSEPPLKQYPITPKSRNCQNCATSATCPENIIDLSKLQAAEALLAMSMGPREANFLIEKWNSQSIKNDIDDSFCVKKKHSPPRMTHQRQYLTKNRRRFYTTFSNRRALDFAPTV